MASFRPSWKRGDPIPTPVQALESIDFERLESPAAYKLLIGAVVPRPIAFISTQNKKGQTNLAPFSFFNAVSSAPPCVMFSVTRKSTGEKKDTLVNIEETRQFVVNTVAEWMIEPMNLCSAEYPYGVSEFEKIGFTQEPSRRIQAPRVKESPIQMECIFEKSLTIGEGGAGSATIVVGRIVMMHVHAPAYQDGKILIREISPVARLAGASYSLLGETLDLPRPQLERR